MSEERVLVPVSPAQLRRGLGIVFFLVGVFYCATMVFATLVSMGRLPGVRLPPEGWGHLYRANMYFMNIAGLGYLGLTLARKGVFFLRALIDFVVGFLIYFGFFFLSAVLLVRGHIPDWASVIPGIILIAYGVLLFRGRQLWSWRKV